jgi:hypothetical protein
MSILSIFKEKKKPQSRRKRLIKALDDLMSKQVRERDSCRCRKCGRERVYHHHIFTKTRLSTRWDISNGVSLCFHCHRWAHAAAEEFRKWVLTWMPLKDYDALYIKSQMRAGFKEIDLEWLLKDMRRAA